MLHRLFLAVLLLFCAAVTTAQTFPQPPDVSAYVPVPPLYKTDGTLNTPIDATITPPAQAGLTPINLGSLTGRMTTGDGINPTNGPNFCLTIQDGGSCQEAKFRTHLDATHVLADDPIRNWGKPGTSHCHEFFGNFGVNAFSTYASLRASKMGTAAMGSDANSTGYWFPCPVITNPFSDGKNYVVRMNWSIAYYLGGNGTTGPTVAYTPPGLRYVFGANMDDPSQSWLQTIIANANAASTFSTRYSLTQGGTFSTQAHYICVGATPSDSLVFKNADGTDPYNGTCNAGQQFMVRLEGPRCWDGKNLWSPGGYRNVIPQIWDNQVGDWVCPYNYYRIANLTFEFQFTQQGFADRSRWAWSCTAGYIAKGGGTAEGLCFHTDWMDGWDENVRNRWEIACIGAEHHTSHECNASQVDPDGHLLTTSGPGVLFPNGLQRNPQVDLGSSYPTNSASTMWRVPPTVGGGGMDMKPN